MVLSKHARATVYMNLQQFHKIKSSKPKHRFGKMFYRAILAEALVDMVSGEWRVTFWYKYCPSLVEDSLLTHITVTLSI